MVEKNQKNYSLKTVQTAYVAALKKTVMLLALISGLSVFLMMLVTTVDVILRIFGISFIGAFDIVTIAGAIAISAALPYTTAVKGHVAIEYFFQKFSKWGRIVVDTIARILSVTLFTLLAWHSIKYGNSMLKSGEVTSTLQIPLFWVPFMIAVSCFLVVLVIIYHIVHPGKELLKP